MFSIAKRGAARSRGKAWWKPTSSWDLITITGNSSEAPSCASYKQVQASSCESPGACNPIQAVSSGWLKGKTWGIRIHKSGYDPGLLLTIRLEIEAPINPIGSNTVLKDQKPPSLPALVQSPVLPPGNVPDPFFLAGGPASPTTQPPGTGDWLINLVMGAYLALNFSDPSRTQACWLCLVSRPPY